MDEQVEGRLSERSATASKYRCRSLDLCDPDDQGCGKVFIVSRLDAPLSGDVVKPKQLATSRCRRLLEALRRVQVGGWSEGL